MKATLRWKKSGAAELVLGNDGEGALVTFLCPLYLLQIVFGFFFSSFVNILNFVENKCPPKKKLDWLFVCDCLLQHEVALRARL